ncbi:hypothetical protein CDD81_1697 [Ophiocordyceps australis]|uniref:Cullin family profile domain-containing protein n=1 Tax=Ophiocordyceps australis TaxID=1399860 RepID=A0A2C5Y082_9HYPO|nr:hypothetical protein CDD81_1697 [Ophiocordyceps australis]
MISGRGGAGGRSGRIRPPRRFVRRNDDMTDLEECWTMLEEALGDIHRKSCGQLSFEQLYRSAYKMVVKKKGDVLYDRVQKFEEKWFADHVIPTIDSLMTKSLFSIGTDHSAGSVNERRQTGEKFLRGMREIWQDHNMSMNMTADILMYLDRGYTLLEPKRIPIFAATIGLFRDQILQSCLSDDSEQLVLDIIVSVMLDQINMEREGDVIDRNLIRGCSRMLSCLYVSVYETESQTLYKTIFEERFLQHSRKFYMKECQQLIRDADARAWLRHTQRRINEEMERCDHTIELRTLPRIIRVVEQTLISEHLQDFMTMEPNGFKWMIDNDRTEDLSILYHLISRIDKDKTALRSILQKRVVELGFEIENVLKNTDFSMSGSAEGGEEGEKNRTLSPAAQQTAAAVKWVDDVLLLKDKFDHLLSECFGDDVIIQSALTKSFSDFINAFGRSAEYVSLYMDDNFKRGIRGMTETEVDASLERAIVLLRYLQDKDLLQTYYQRHLARRLLHGKSESHDAERQVLSRMKQELGQQFTSKFEGMFRDLSASGDLTSGYRHYMSKLGDWPSIELNVNVLTTNYWPHEIMGRQASIGEGSRISCTYPRQIKTLQASFGQYYLADRSGRKLTWVGTMGSADIKCTFPAIAGKSGALSRERRYEINVPTFAMVVMLLFNDLDVDRGLSCAQVARSFEGAGFQDDQDE